MSVEDWARLESTKKHVSSDVGRWSKPGTVEAGQWGIVHAFDALLSDEAVEAAARANWTPEGWASMYETEKAREVKAMRAAIQAAVRAVNEGGSSE